MAQVVNQHFDLPFRFSPQGNAVVVEQDTSEDIRNCVEAAVRTPIGTRFYVPEFGITDPTFSMSPISMKALQAQLQNSEPRARTELQEWITQLVARIRIGVDTGG